MGAVSTMGDRDDENNPHTSGQTPWSENENLFSDFEDQDEFEDSDRDSDFAAIYTEVEEEDPEPEEDEWELEEELPEQDNRASDEDWQGDEPENEPDLWDTAPNPPGAFDDEPPEAETSLNDSPVNTAAPPVPEEDWEDLDEDDDYEEEEIRELNISLGMIVVAIFALVLLGAGGYGVIEQRAQMQEEIRQLQSRLATSAPPREVAASRQEAAQTAQANEQLQQQVDQLTRENRNLQAIVSGLEKQLTAQQEAISRAVPPAPKPTPTPAPKPTAKPAAPGPQSSSAPPADGSWFVNFSSYSQRSTAQSWVSKLQPSQGRVIVSSGQANGKTIYRVRVVDLPDKASAEAIARSLEKEFSLPKLWVGKSG